MRVVVHDYAGHPFQVELSRELARRGHEVLHLFSGSITTPRGTLTRRPDDPAGFSVDAISLGTRIPREHLLTRWRLEARHGFRVVARLKRFEPEIVISGNTPLEAQKRIAGYCQSTGTRFVYWVQDLIGEAARRLLPTRLPAVARPVTWYFEGLEHRLLWEADDVVVISEDFLPFVPLHAEVIENWAPIEQLPVLPKDNPWSRRHGLESSVNLLYSGTLGMKHDPEFLLGIANSVRDIADANVVVVSEGTTAEWLRREAVERPLPNLRVLPFQPFEDLARMLASADILVGVLGREAGVFSVPSKVLTYLCAQRALLLAVPAENLSARIVTRIGAGAVVEPENAAGVHTALRSLICDPDERAAMGRRARAYAEENFPIDKIAGRFEPILRGERKGRTTQALQRLQDAETTAAVSVIVISYECRDAVRRCIESLDAERRNLELEVVVVDNASTDGTVDMLRSRFQWVRVIANPVNAGFASAANQALWTTGGRHLLFLNPDTVVPPQAIARAYEELERHPDVGMLGVKLVRPDGTFDHACKRGFPTIASALYYFFRLNRLRPRSPRFAHYTAGLLGEDEAGPVDAINGAFMLVRREAVADVGPMDERYWLYAEDLDWCRRFWERGWKVLYWPGADVVHWKGGSSGDTRSWALNRVFHRSMWLFYAKHYAPRHPRLLSRLVWAGVWAKFGLSAILNAARRPPAHDWSGESAVPRVPGAGPGG
jgi:colanic acid biosynthesis glycosyl transferase WcaI